MISVSDLTEPWPDDTELCRADGWGAISDDASEFRSEGVLIKPGLLDEATVDAYSAAYIKDVPERVTGFNYATPYMDFPYVKKLCLDPRITGIAEELIGEPMGLHLNLAKWVSTQRNWHQDGYLNPDSNMDWYIAVWVALDDIHPDAGPFEYIPGSHRNFGIIRHDKMLAALKPEERGSLWPRHSERILTPFFEQVIDQFDLPVTQFNAKKGDVLFWHSRLLHRGSAPKDPKLERRAIISHYSGVKHRPDMPEAVHEGDGWYFPVNGGPTSRMNLLNAGAGTHYAKGWVNTDVWETDTTTPDVRVKSGEPYPFPDNHFDAIYLGHVLEHVSWPAVPWFLDDMNRVGKPGAWVLVVGPDVYRTIQRWHEGLEPWWLVENAMEHADVNHQPGREHEVWVEAHHHWNCHGDRVRSLLESCGFVEIEDLSTRITQNVRASHDPMDWWEDGGSDVTWPVTGYTHWQCAFRCRVPE